MALDSPLRVGYRVLVELARKTNRPAPRAVLLGARVFATEQVAPLPAQALRALERAGRAPRAIRM